MNNDVIQWKCRRCGGIKESSASPNAAEGLERLLNVMRHRNPIEGITTHICPDGNIGVADICGAERRLQ